MNDDRFVCVLFTFPIKDEDYNLVINTLIMCLVVYASSHIQSLDKRRKTYKAATLYKKIIIPFDNRVNFDLK